MKTKLLKVNKFHNFHRCTIHIILLLNNYHTHTTLYKTPMLIIFSNIINFVSKRHYSVCTRVILNANATLNTFITVWVVSCVRKTWKRLTVIIFSWILNWIYFEGFAKLASSTRQCQVSLQYLPKGHKVSIQLRLSNTVRPSYEQLNCTKKELVLLPHAMYRARRLYFHILAQVIYID